MLTKLDRLKLNNDAPQWMTEEGYKQLDGTYLLPNETPREMWERVANSSAKYLNKPDLAPRFFKLLWNNWLGLASPVASNSGTERGLNISCYSNFVPDSVNGIMDSMTELAVMTKNGGGVGVHWNKVRPRGSKIHGNGVSDGVVPFMKIQDSITIGISQGSTRRGASVAYLPIDHGDFWEFLKMRRPEGDVNRQCLNIHHGICITDKFMEDLKNDVGDSREKWKAILKARFETGEPYLFFSDNVSRNRPDTYKQRNLEVHGSNLCNEIYLHTDEEHSFVCCLSSLNVARFDEWKDTDAVELSIWFLDGVLTEFIDKASKVVGMEKAVRSAVKGRALGLGVMGFHSLLQSKMLPFDHFETMRLNAQIFRLIREKADKATMDLAKEYGEPEWCVGSGRRNTHTLALAPTVSNSLISGDISPGIEPWAANSFVRKGAKGTFMKKNEYLEKLFEEKGKNTDETWKSVTLNEGSVQHLDFLSADEKEVFLTARELNQFAIVKLAAQRQKWIDQGQSVNLFFPANADVNYIHQVHKEAWESGLNGLYYCRTSSVLKGEAGSREYKRESTECKACEG